MGGKIRVVGRDKFVVRREQMGSKQSSMFVQEARDLLHQAHEKLYDITIVPKTNEEKQKFLESAIKLTEEALQILKGKSYT